MRGPRPQRARSNADVPPAIGYPDKAYRAHVGVKMASRPLQRREVIAALGGAAAAWPLAARAQQRTRLRRIGVFMPGAPDNADYQVRNAAFLQGLGEFGWTVSRTVEIEYRWGQGDGQRYAVLAAELVALEPEVILGTGTAVVTALLRATQNIPIVFVEVVDPVGGGLVDSLARPGGNATGFASPEFGFSSKW